VTGPADNPWLGWAKRLHAIASTGVHFATQMPGGAYDVERYREVADIANAMLASLGGVPVRTVEALFAAEFATGYATPRVDVRAAIVRGDEILLVRERTDGLWSLPGGWADAGLSPAANVEKEVWEEAGIRVRARSLYALIDKTRHPYNAGAREVYKLFFLCDPLDSTVPQPGPEISELGFFKGDALPPLSFGRVLERDIHAAFRFAADDTAPVMFD
jgi:ADP-ribose pyrophosphatase YjhB (NUDIX family)